MYRRIEETIKSGEILTIPAGVERFFTLIKGSNVDISLGLDGDSFDKIKEGNQIGSPNPFGQVRIRNPHVAAIEIDAAISVEPLRQVVLAISGGSVELSSAVEVSNLPKRADGSLNTGPVDAQGARFVDAGLSFENDKLLVDAGVPIEGDQVKVDPNLKNAAGNVPVQIAGVSPTSAGKLPVDIGAMVSLAADTTLNIADGTSVNIGHRVKTQNGTVIGVPKSTSGNPAIAETDFVSSGELMRLAGGGSFSHFLTVPRKTGTGSKKIKSVSINSFCFGHLIQPLNSDNTYSLNLYAVPENTDMAALFGVGCRNTLTTKPTALGTRFYSCAEAQSSHFSGQAMYVRESFPLIIQTGFFICEVHLNLYHPTNAGVHGTDYMINWTIEYEE